MKSFLPSPDAHFNFFLSKMSLPQHKPSLGSHFCNSQGPIKPQRAPVSPTEAVKAQFYLLGTCGGSCCSKNSRTALGKMEKLGMKGCWVCPKITAVLSLRFLLRVKGGENITDLPLSGSDAAFKQPCMEKWHFLAFPSKEGAPAVELGY